MKKVKYLVIGNGIAGLSAVRKIREKDESGSICMISKESRNTYYRIKLTELIKKDFTEEEVLVNKEEWYLENDVEVLLDTVVKEIDTENKEVKLDDDKIMSYEKLLLATGSNPFVPPIKGREKEGVFALRTLDDLNKFKEYLEDCKEVAVIGGGLLGLEAAWSLHELGKKVNIIEFNDGLLNRQLDEELSGILGEDLKEKGFKLHLGVAADEILGKDKATGVKLSNGDKLDLDAILVSSGVRSDLSLAEGTDLEFDKGIKVNSKLETNVPNIYAAGDVAEIDGITLGLWTAALEMGRLVGDNMTGGDSKYDVPKLFASLNIGDISLFSAGKISDTEEIYESRENGSYGKIFVDNNKIVGGILYGDIKLMNKLRPAVFDNKDIKEFLKDNNLESTFK